MGGVFEAGHYRQAREQLIADPIIQAMATDLREGLAHGIVEMGALVHDETDNPNYDFMLSTLDEYHKRGGQVPTHIGGPAEAILTIVHM